MKTMFKLSALFLFMGLMFVSCEPSYKISKEVGALLRASGGVKITELTSLDGSTDIASSYADIQLFFTERSAALDTVRLRNTLTSMDDYGTSYLLNETDNEISNNGYSFYFGASGTLTYSHFSGSWYYLSSTGNSVRFKTKPSIPSDPTRYLTFTKL